MTTHYDSQGRRILHSHPSTWEQEVEQLRARVEALEEALRDIADGMGEMTHREIGRYAPAVARAALQQPTESKEQSE